MTQDEKRIIVVTGGSRGLGRVICQTFAGPDTHIYFNYHASETGAQETGELISAAAGTWDSERVDIASMSAVSAWFKRITATSQKIDVLILDLSLSTASPARSRGLFPGNRQWSHEKPSAVPSRSYLEKLSHPACQELHHGRPFYLW